MVTYEQLAILVGWAFFFGLGLGASVAYLRAGREFAKYLERLLRDD